MVKGLVKKDRPLLRRYSAALTSFLTDKIEEGITLAAICRDYKEQGLPTEKQIYRWKKKYPEFREAIDLAYQTFFYKKMDEMEDLSKQLMVITATIKEATKEEVIAFRMRADAIRQRLDILKFTLAKLAPKMVPDLRDVPSTAVNIAPPSITVVNYSDIKKEA